MKAYILAALLLLPVVIAVDSGVASAPECRCSCVYQDTATTDLQACQSQMITCQKDLDSYKGRSDTKSTIQSYIVWGLVIAVGIYYFFFKRKSEPPKGGSDMKKNKAMPFAP